MLNRLSIISVIVLLSVTNITQAQNDATDGDATQAIQALESQIELISRQLQDLKRQQPTSTEAADAEGSTPSEPMDVSSNGGILTFASRDGDFEWFFDSRLQFDAAGYYGSDNGLSSGIEGRRIRFALKGNLWDSWKAELDVDFADNEIDVKDAWMAYTGFGENTEIKIGNFKAPFSLEEMTSSRMVTFMERALPNVFAIGRRVGASYTQWGERWRISGAFFAQEFDELDESENDESLGYSARLNYLPYRSESSVWLVGASYASYEPHADSGDRIRFRARPETSVEGDRFLNTGRVRDVDTVNVYGIETVFQNGPLIVQGEYIKADLDRFAGNVDASYDGWYVFGSYMLTGEQRQYNASAAEFDVFTPNRPAGAWEIALRASSLDLNDAAAGVTGGNADQYTLGLNYYPNRNLRFMLNYSTVDHGINADGDGDFLGDDDYSIVQARFQVIF